MSSAVVNGPAGPPTRIRPPFSSTTIRLSGNHSTAVGCENVATAESANPAGTSAAAAGVPDATADVAPITKPRTTERPAVRRIVER